MPSLGPTESESGPGTWLPLFAICVILVLLYLWIAPLTERVERTECKRLYRAARTHSDSLVVDARVTFNQSGKGGVSCGQRRRFGELK